MTALRVLCLLLMALILIPSAAVLANLWLGAAEWRRGAPGARWAIIAAGLTVASMAVFFTWVFPANQATANWTVQPENWRALRRDWEYGHAASPALVAGGLLATALAVVRRA